MTKPPARNPWQEVERCAIRRAEQYRIDNYQPLGDAVMHFVYEIKAIIDQAHRQALAAKDAELAFERKERRRMREGWDRSHWDVAHLRSQLQQVTQERDELKARRAGHVQHIKLFMGPDYGTPTPEHEDSFLTHAINGLQSNSETFRAAYQDREASLTRLQAEQARVRELGQAPGLLLLAEEVERLMNETRETLQRIESRHERGNLGDESALIAHYRKNLEHYTVRAVAVRALLAALSAPPQEPTT